VDHAHFKVHWREDSEIHKERKLVKERNLTEIRAYALISVCKIPFTWDFA